MRVVESRVEGSILPEVDPIDSFKFKVRRIDRAHYACFMPCCETPIKDGWEDMEIKNGEIVGPKGKRIPSLLDPNGVTYRADGPGGYSHFSSQARLVVDIPSARLELVNNNYRVNSNDAESVQQESSRLIKMLDEHKVRVFLDDRYLDRQRIYLGACSDHEFNLRQLVCISQNNGDAISKAGLIKVINSAEPIPF